MSIKLEQLSRSLTLVFSDHKIHQIQMPIRPAGPLPHACATSPHSKPTPGSTWGAGDGGMYKKGACACARRAIASPLVPTWACNSAPG